MDSGTGDRPAGTVWTAGQVARHLGIAESTLRTWHRRYGVGPHSSQPGRYRRYTVDDLARLQRMRDLIRSGTLPSEAARVIEQMGGPPLALDLVELLSGARALDTARCLTVLSQGIARRGVLAVWERVCRPALVAIDADQREDPGCVDSEHVLSWAVAAALHRVERPPATASPPVLLTCTDAEQHTLPLDALAAALSERRVPVRMLGAATPTSSLLHAVSVLRPAAVVLWSQQSDTARPDAVRALSGYPLRRFTAGPGWPPRRRAGAAHLGSLAEAIDLLTTSS